ncbi:MAG: DNA polymerase I [Candidatus Omnitrophica bacterium ADurb.Bin314]|nr:MAG: DNA polymerase I [Candidatus Omnitrophica bacterium ADurb.Bin314]
MTKKVPQGRLFLIDGNSFCYRAFYAIQGLTNSRGEPTNAIYGFVTMMRKLVEDQRPEFIAVCFDPKGKTFRHERYRDYKAHRKPMPPELVSQIEPIKEFCRISRLAMFEKQGFEADDVIGTLAVRAERQGLEVFIVTGDKDAFQLVNEKVRILQPHKDNLVYDIDGVKRKYDGLGPDKIVEVLALMGDASDNIPGVPGIGEKTAIKLMQRFGSVEGILKNLGEISSEKVRSSLKENEADLRLSLSLATIDTDVEMAIDWGTLRFQAPDDAALLEFFKRYEFRGLMKQFSAVSEEDKSKRDYRVITDPALLKKLAEKLKQSGEFSFDTETTSTDPMRAHLVGMSFAIEPHRAFYVPTASKEHPGPGLPLAEVLRGLKLVLEDAKIGKCGQNIKYDAMVMARHGIELRGVRFDTMIASYLIDPIKRNHNLDDISLEHLNVKKIPVETLIGKGKTRISMAEVPLEKITEYACEDADCVLRLAPVLKRKLAELDLAGLYEKVELPLAGILGKMETNGVALDTVLLGQLSRKTGEEIDGLLQKIHAEAGEEFNVDSPKQLAEILFVKKKIPSMKKTKTGYSTDASVLEKLALSHELPRLVLEYRERAKLRSTYLDALPEMVNPETGCVHTSYHQTTTDTGRLSSSEPNLQNIPVKTEAGRLIRKAFVSRRKTGKILSADYSQIELRILAHFCEEPNLVKAFEEDRDIHAFTATLLYDVREKDVTREMRNVAKTINFSVLYGKTSFGLSQDLQISIQEADAFIRNYFGRYAKVRDFLESQKEQARKAGYLTTILGRRSYFPNLRSSNVALRNYAERAAINAPLQGSAADLIKLAMIRVQGLLESEKSEALMIMQVHDELVFDVPAAGVEALGRMVKKEMEGAYALKVPLKADVAAGDSWYKN